MGIAVVNEADTGTRFNILPYILGFVVFGDDRIAFSVGMFVLPYEVVQIERSLDNLVTVFGFAEFIKRGTLSYDEFSPEYVFAYIVRNIRQRSIEVGCKIIQVNDFYRSVIQRSAGSIEVYNDVGFVRLACIFVLLISLTADSYVVVNRRSVGEFELSEIAVLGKVGSPAEIKRIVQCIRRFEISFHVEHRACAHRAGNRRNFNVYVTAVYNV